MPNKLVVSCFFGGLIGGLVALQLGFYLWWVGILVGVLLAGVSFEFRTIVQAIPVAWRMATSWRPDVEWWRNNLNLFVASWLIMFVITSNFSLFYLLFGLLFTEFELGIAISLAIAIIFSVILPVFFGLATMLTYSNENKEDIKGEVRKIIIRANPFCVFVVYPSIGAWWLLKRAHHLPIIVAVVVSLPFVFLYYFFYHLFVLTYSDARTLAMLFAAVGVIVSYVSGNALFGATIGTILGFFSFEVVSRRWLGLIPMR